MIAICIGWTAALLCKLEYDSDEHRWQCSRNRKKEATKSGQDIAEHLIGSDDVSDTY